MTDSVFDCLTSAWPIVIKRFRNSNLVKDAPANYWEDDFFVSLAKKKAWAVNFYESWENAYQRKSRGENKDVPSDCESESEFELNTEEWVKEYQRRSGDENQSVPNDCESQSESKLETEERVKEYGRMPGDENENVPNESESQPKFKMKPEDAEAIIFVLSKQLKSHFSNEDEQVEFCSSFLIALEKFVPLDDEEADLLRAAKDVMACWKSDPLPNGAQYMVNESSGSGCSDYSPLIEQTLTAVTEIETRNQRFWVRTPSSREDAGRSSGVPIITLETSIIRIIRRACSNGRFEAALSLAIAQNNSFELLTGGVSKWMTPLVHALKSPAAVEREYVRLKTRLVSFERCQEIYPNLMKLYSTCLLLRFEREERIKMINSYEHLHFTENDLKLLNDALKMSKDDVSRISFFLWLKKEYFNRIQDAKIKELEPWIQSHKEEVSLAVAHKAIQMNPDLKTLVTGLQKLSETIDAFGFEERRLLCEIRKLFSAVNYEIEKAEKLTLVCLDGSPVIDQICTGQSAWPPGLGSKLLLR